MRTHAVVDSPLGPLTLVEQDGAVVGLYMADQRHRPEIEGPRDDTVLPALQEQLGGYWRRELKDFDVPLKMAGTPFQQGVWAALRTIPYGETWTYGELALAIGNPAARRAVGLANGRNPVSVVVPCHRVVGSGGSLTGYGGGLTRKQWLLDLEAGREVTAAVG
jgi:methylated-DNA-[protein]-cysteine S-methyltransferase